MLYSKNINNVFERLGRDKIFDKKLAFELSYYFYTLSHLFLQSFNIYKTELYAYNFTLFFFSMIFLSKRLWFKIWIKVKMKYSVDNSKWKVMLFLITTVLLLNFLYCGIKTFYYYSIGSTFCLFYPYSLCLLL